MEESYERSNQHIRNLSGRLTKIVDEFDKVKKNLEKKTNTMSDTGPLVEMKTSLQRLKKEIKGLDLRIGVVVRLLSTM